MPSDGSTPRLFAARGWGSSIVEAAFELSGFAYQIEPIDPENAADRARLKSINPLNQIPALILPDGSVMTETAAMVLLAADAPSGGMLAPPAGDPARPAFLRWLVFMVGSIYPTFTYGDEPIRYVGAEAGPTLRASTDAERKAMWRSVEAVAGRPWFLGERRSAVDLYIWAMTHWRPGPAWFVAETPALVAIADRVAADPLLAGVAARNGWS